MCWCAVKKLLTHFSLKHWLYFTFYTCVISAVAASSPCRSQCCKNRRSPFHCTRWPNPALVFCFILYNTHCWLGDRKGIRPVKNGGWWRWHWLVRMEWRPAGWLVCLPLLIFPCTIKSRSSLLAPAHPGGPGKRAVKRLCCVWCVVVLQYLQVCWFVLGFVVLVSVSSVPCWVIVCDMTFMHRVRHKTANQL